MQFICLVSSPCPYHFAAEFLSEFDFTAEFDFELDFTYPPASETDTMFGNDECPSTSLSMVLQGSVGPGGVGSVVAIACITQKA